MAVSDDLTRLAAQDVYLTRSILGASLTEVFRGRLRQALNGNWVFNSSMANQNETVGLDLGPIGSTWSSSESPLGGIQISISYVAGQVPATAQNILLTGVIPADFAD
jgi:hypothetical protein